MVAHANHCLPEEACGVIGGIDDLARLVLPVENELHSPVRFRMAPGSQLKAFEEMDKIEVELLGIFHSHPTGPAVPSPTDIAEFYYPGTVVIILSPAPDGKAADSTVENGVFFDGWQIKGFLIENDRFAEIKLDHKV